MIYIILFLVNTVGLFLIFHKLSSILNQMQRNAYDMSSENGSTEDILNNQAYELEKINSSIDKIQYDISDLRATADVYRKYNLPSKEEQKLIDLANAENEVI